MQSELKSAAPLPRPEVYEQEYQFWPWGRLIARVIDVVADAAPNGARVFDYMCGTGYLLSAIKDRRPDIIASGCDIHLPFVKYGLSQRPGMNLTHADARTFSPPGESDVILCTSGLHHLSFDEQRTFLAKIAGECSEATVVVFGEETLRPYETPQERLESAVDLNSDLVRLGIEQKWPVSMLHAVLGVLRNDVLLDGEHKRDIQGWTSLIEESFLIRETIQTWHAPSGGGDFALVCKRAGAR